MPFAHKARPYLQFFFGLVFLFIFWPPLFYNQPVPGLDTSWNIAIHLAYKYRLVFGKDFVFTYGPLGMLETRLPISVNFWVYLLFDAYLLTSFALVIKSIFRDHFNAPSLLFIFVTVALGMYKFQDQWYFLFFCYFLFHFLRKGGTGAIVQAALLSVVCFYFKVSLGMTAIFFFLTGITYALVFKKTTLRFFLILLVSYFIGIVLLAQLLRVDLKGYLTTSLQLINDYNDAMFRPLESGYAIFLVAALSILFIALGWFIAHAIGYIRKREWRQSPDELFIFGMVTLGLFVSFKASFVRSDAHMHMFFKGAAPFIGLFYLFNSGKQNRVIAACASWIVLGISGWALNNLPASYRPLDRLANGSIFRYKLGEVRNYFQGLDTYAAAVKASDRLDTLNNPYKALIGQHTVDILPIEISKIYFNGLHYDPRPVIQSYAAYNESLDSLNSRKYGSADAPEYLLFSIASIDDRQPFFDESRTKLAILQHYDLVGRIEDDLLLKKRKTQGYLQALPQQDTTEISLGEDIPVKKSQNLAFTQFFTNYDLRGKLLRLFFHPPGLKMILRFDNGQTRTFRVIKPAMSDGVILNKYVESNDEFQLLMQSSGTLNANVRAFRLESDRPNHGFSKKIRMVTTWYAFGNKPDNERLADSLGLARLFDVYRRTPPIKLDPSLYIPDSVRYSLEQVNTHSPFISINGWSFRANGDNTNNTVKVVLRSENAVYELPTKRLERPDVNGAYKRTDLQYAGFAANMAKVQLPPGNYLIGMAFYDDCDGKKYMGFTDQSFPVGAAPKFERSGDIDPRAMARGDLRFVVDAIVEEEDQTLVRGWAIGKAAASGHCTTNLILKGDHDTYRIATENMPSGKVVSYLNDPTWQNCGFKALVPTDALPAGIYSIGLEQTSSGGDASVRFDDRKLYIGVPANTPVPLPALPPLGDFHSGVDLAQDEQESFRISGWAIDNPDSVQDNTIDIVLTCGNLIFKVPTALKSRPDVRDSFKSHLNLDNSGFSAEVNKKNLPPGKYRIGIYIHHNGGKGSLKFIDQTLQK
jgi:hypothetical protein